MIKTKPPHSNHQNNSKIKTLQSNCKYEQDRFNQATYQQNYNLKHQYNQADVNHKTWTDNRIQQIKKKYDPKIRKHQRNFTYSQNFTELPILESQIKNFSKVSQKYNQKLVNRVPLRQRSFSNFSNNYQRKINCELSADSRNGKVPIRSQLDITKLFQNKKSQVTYTENIHNNNHSKKYFYLQQSSFNIDPDFEKQSKNSCIQEERNLNKQKSRISSHSEENHQKSKISIFNTNYDPRIKNIDQINLRIKKALEDFSLNDIKIRQNCYVNRKNPINYGKNNAEKYPIKYESQKNSISAQKINLSNNKFEIRKKWIQNQNQKVNQIVQQQNAAHKYVSLNNHAQIINKNQQKSSLLYKKYPKQQTFIKNQKSEITLPLKQQDQQKKSKVQNDNPFEQTRSILVVQNYSTSQRKARQTPQKMIYSRNNLLTPQKLNTFKSIKNKYENKVSYRSTITDYEVQSRINQANNDSKVINRHFNYLKSGLDLINIKQNKSQQRNQNEELLQSKDQISQFQQKNFDNFIKLTKSGIQMRKKLKLTQQQTTTQKDNNAFQFFQKLMKKQIQLDQNLRKAKFWFMYLKDNSKYQKLNLQLQQKVKMNNNLRFLYDKISLKQFQMMDEEIDPFFSVRITVYSYSELVDLYLQCQEHWQKYIQTPQIIQKLIKNKWIQSIDMQIKGFALLSDLTRFMNFNSDSFCRNRDLALIFKRLTQITADQTADNFRCDKQAMKSYYNVQKIRLSQKCLKRLLQCTMI